MPRPDLSRVPEWYHRYINQVQENDVMEALTKQASSFVQFLESIPVAKRDYRYADDKWTIKEVLQHILDAERIFAYRALCFARKEATPLPGFDENIYAANSKAANRDWNDLTEEFKIVRQSTQILFRSFDDEQMETTGTSNGNPVYVMAIGFIIPSHLNHHVTIIKERYL